MKCLIWASLFLSKALVSTNYYNMVVLFSIEVTYEIRVFLKGAQKEVFSSIFKKSL